MRSSSSNPARGGIAKRAAEASARKLAAREAELAARGTKGTRTSPRNLKKRQNYSALASGRRAPTLTNNRAVTPSQIIAESQSLLSPDESTGAPLLAAEVIVESQLTTGTDFPSNKTSLHGPPPPAKNCAWSQHIGNDADDLSTGASSVSVTAADGATLVAADANVDADDLFEGNADDDEFDRLAAEMGDGLGDLNDYSSDQFSLNERRHYYMDRVSITSKNRAAVEFVYMVEAETLTRDSGTRGLGDVKKLLHSKYIELIRQIPSTHFSEFGLREDMTGRYYGAKKGGASGFYTKVIDTKQKVKSVTGKLDGIGTPLSKIPSGRGLTDVREQFILEDYKAVMGAVSLYHFV